jgi:hypothetical protein
MEIDKLQISKHFRVGRPSTQDMASTNTIHAMTTVGTAQIGWQIGLLMGNSNPRYLYKF